MSDKPIVRFAPSPTGHLHIGGVRTALFNYLFVKNLGGRYVLRIEDTDISRSSKKMAQEIIKGLQWLGIQWDDGPFYQSQRFDLYRQVAAQLLDSRKAYRCFCTKEELEERKNASHENENDKSQRLFMYDRKCLHLTENEIEAKLAQSSPFVIRFQIPIGMTYFKDRIHKEMKIANTELEDFVILKSDNSPTYHLSVVVDDHLMQITDVLRGDDHISNTFKQVLLFKALDLKPPKYAHLPLILGADKKKLSKRHGETSILEFKRLGYLPGALINYLSQLSWMPADSKKIVSLDELIKQFALSKLSKSSPVFDYDKLLFLNGRAIQKKDSRELVRLLLEDPQFEANFAHVAEEKKIALIQLLKPRIKTLPEFAQKFALYLAQTPQYSESELQKLNENYSNTDIITYLNLLLPQLKNLKTFDKQTVEEIVRQCADHHDLKAADFIHPARFALTTETVSPSIFEVFEFFGKDLAIQRLQALIDYLEKS
jgi:glutamyl-tRNA synthetase